MSDEKDARIRTLERELADRQREYRTLSDDHERLEGIARAAEELIHFALTCHQCGAELLMPTPVHCQDCCSPDCSDAHDPPDCPTGEELLAAYRKATGEPK